MYSLLVVDDEKHYADSLSDTVPWSSIGIGNVYKAYSPSQALALIESHTIDMMMTDIRMPAMSGLELIEAVRARKPNIKCFLLTGYGEFEYAKQAIQLNAVDYLLKPVKDDQLLDTVQRIIRQLDQERKAEQAYAVYRDNIMQLKSQLLLQALTGEAEGRGLADKMRHYDVPIAQQGNVELCLLQLGEPFRSYDLYSYALLQFAVTNILEELLKERYDIWSASDEDGVIAVVIYDHGGAPVDLEWTSGRLKQLEVETRILLRGDVTAVSAGACVFPDELRVHYMRAKTMLTERMSQRRLPSDSSESDADLMKTLYKAPHLTHLLETEQWEEAEERIRNLLSLLHSAGSPERLRDVFFFLSNAFLYFVHKTGKSLLEVLTPEQSKYLRGKNILHIAQLEEWAFDVLRGFRERFAAASVDRSEASVKKVQQHILHHLDKDLSLTMLADLVYLHPNHLSKVFKQSTDRTVSHYIYDQRMLKASELLKHSGEKIYVIGQQVGYPNTNWFIKKFKEYYNLTPQEYRDRMRLQ